MTFEALFLQYHDEIYRYLWRMTYEDALAQDLTQETFLKAFRAYEKLPPQSHHRAWLYRIATNTCHDHWRRNRPEVPWEEGAEDFWPSDENIAAQYEAQEALAHLQGAVAQLPPKQQQALILSRYQGLSYAEIAEVLGTNEASVRANVYQAIRHLRIYFEGHPGEEAHD
jgi:RNA polymerase sigma-70 factor (ECF subfamily)